MLVDPANGDYRLSPSFSLPNPVPLPTLPGGNQPPIAPPPAPVMTEPVVVAGAPTIRIVIGSTTRLARFSGGSGTSTLTFSYTIARKDRDTDGITVFDRIRLPAGAHVRTLSGAAVATAFSAGDATGIRVEPPSRLRAARR